MPQITFTPSPRGAACALHTIILFAGYYGQMEALPAEFDDLFDLPQDRARFVQALRELASEIHARGVMEAIADA
jgi:hypothetical protein